MQAGPAMKKLDSTEGMKVGEKHAEPSAWFGGYCEFEARWIKTASLALPKARRFAPFRFV